MKHYIGFLLACASLLSLEPASASWPKDGGMAQSLVGAVDQDADGVVDEVDNCLAAINSNQLDSNGDGFGNICDPDLTNDGVVNSADLGIFRLAFFSTPATPNWDADADFNGDGVVNAVDLGTMRRFFFLPPGPAGVVYWAGADDGDWETAENWMPPGAPQPWNKVVIDIPTADVAVSITESPVSVYSIASRERLVVSEDNAITVRGPSELDGGLVLDDDASLVALGPEAIVSVEGPVDGFAGDLYASDGGQLTMTSAVEHTAQASLSIWRAEGANSRLIFPNLVSVISGDVGVNTTTRLAVEALGGAVVELPELVSLFTPNSSGSALRHIRALADGAGSQVKMPQLTSFGDDEPRLFSSLTALGGGAIQVPFLIQPDGVSFSIDDSSSLDISQLTSITRGAVTLTGAEFSFPNLVDLTASEVTLDGASADFSNVTTIFEGGLEFENGSTANFSAVTNFDSVCAAVRDASVLSLPGVTSFTQKSGDCRCPWSSQGTQCEWIADDTGSRLQLPNLTDLTVGEFGIDVRTDLSIRARDGGLVNLPALTSLLVPDSGGPATHLVRLAASGAQSSLQMPLLSSARVEDPGSSGSFSASNGSDVRMPLLTQPYGFSVTVSDEFSTIDVTQLMSLTDGDLVLIGGDFSLPDLIEVTGGTVRIERTFVDLSSLQTLADGRIWLRDSGSVDVSGVTAFDGSYALAESGEALSLPGVTSYRHIGPNTMSWLASGEGSRLIFPNLTGCVLGVFGDDQTARWTVRAQLGGVVELPALQTLEVTDSFGPADRSMTVIASGAGSLIDLPALVSFRDFDLPAGSGNNSSLRALSLGEVNFPDNVNFINITVSTNGAARTP